MAFPTIQTGDTQNGTVTSNSNSWTLTFPTNIAAGDLILAMWATDGQSGANSLSGGTWRIGGQIFGGTAVTLQCAKLVATGSESGSITLSLTASEQGGWRLFRITGWEGTLGTSFSNDVNSGSVVLAPGSSSGTSQPDPSSLNPNNWDVEDTLWFAVCGVDTSRTISGYPLPDNQSADVSGGAGGATLGICTDDLAQASLDPGTFTISTNDDWGTATIAVRPAALVETTPHRRIHRVSSLPAMDRAGAW